MGKAREGLGTDEMYLSVNGGRDHKSEALTVMIGKTGNTIVHVKPNEFPPWVLLDRAWITTAPRDKRSLASERGSF